MIRGAKTRLRGLKRDDLPQHVHWIKDLETRHLMATRCPLHCGGRMPRNRAPSRLCRDGFHEKPIMGILREEYLVHE